MLLAMIFRSGHPSHRVASIWSRLILWTCGIEVTVEGAEHLKAGQTYIVASNHQSLFDTPIVFAHLPLSFRVLYKRSLNRIPFLGWHLFLSGHVGVERSNAVQARRSLEHGAERIRGGTSVVVFPEGTRSYDGVMRAFKRGSFLLAIKAATAVVPMTIIGSHRIMRRGEVTVHPGQVRLKLDAPIAVDALEESDAPRLSKEVRDVIRRNLAAVSESATEPDASRDAKGDDLESPPETDTDTDTDTGLDSRGREVAR